MLRLDLSCFPSKSDGDRDSCTLCLRHNMLQTAVLLLHLSNPDQLTTAHFSFDFTVRVQSRATIAVKFVLPVFRV